MDNEYSGRVDRLLDRPKLADEVVEALRQSILSGRFQPGEHLVLESIAAELGVSAMPVREALIALSHEGLVLSVPRRGFRANPPSPADLGDIFELHAHLAGMLTGRAALSAGADDIARIEEVHDELVKAADGLMTPEAARNLSRLNHQFHRLIHNAADGDYVRRFLRSTTRLIRRDQYAIEPSWVEATLRDHPRIIAALKARDADEARRITEMHFTMERNAGSATAGKS